MSVAGDDAHARPRRRRMEIFAFLFLTAVMIPALGVILNTIALLPHVYSASLVFHAIDAG